MSERSTEHDWAALVNDWRAPVRSPASAPDVAALRARLERQRRAMMLWVLADVLVSVLFVAAAAYALARYPGPATTMLAANILGMLAAAWAFSIWNRRGVWRPLGETTEMYLALARLRCRRRLRALRYAAALVVAQVAIVLVWASWGPRAAPGPRPAWLAAVPVGVVLGFAAAIAWAWRRTRQELRELDALARDAE